MVPETTDIEPAQTMGVEAASSAIQEILVGEDPPATETHGNTGLLAVTPTDRGSFS